MSSVALLVGLILVKAAAGFRPTSSATMIDLMLQHGACPLAKRTRCGGHTGGPIPVFLELVSPDGNRAVNFTSGVRGRRVRCGNEFQEFILVGDRDLRRADARRKKLLGVSIEARTTPDGVELSSSWLPMRRADG